MPLAPHDHQHDERWMRRALALARQGEGFVSPNPMVGCVIVRDGEVVAEGYHHQVGKEHAEIDALKKLDFQAKDCDLYVSLEPCCHHGRTPPCADAIIRAGVRSVHVAMVDPNPLVAGGGINRLRDAGIGVEVGVLEEESKQLNERFITYISKKRPFVLVKAAASLDGRIATRSFDSGQTSGGISGPESHRLVHQLRHAYDAILVGASTVRYDNPQLTTRLPDRESVRHPVKIVLDALGETPAEVRLLDGKPVIFVSTSKSRKSWREAMRDAGAEVWVLPSDQDRLDLSVLLTRLAKEKHLASVLVEGGSQVIGSFFEQKLVDKLALFLTPRLIGAQGLPLVGGLSVEALTDAPRLRDMRVKAVGEDILVEAYPE